MSMGRIRSPGLINQRAPGRRRPLLLALLALLVVLLTEQIIEYYEQRVAVEAEQVSTLSYLSTVRARLEGVINSNLLLVHGLTAVIAANPDIDQAGFAHIARGLVGKDSALRNIAGAPGMVISLMYPLTGNESAMGLDYRTHPTQRAAAIHAMESGHAVVAGPLPLVQGGTGIIVREPVFVPSDVPGSSARPWGLVSSVIDADVLYRKAGLDSLNPSIRVAIRGRDGTGAKGPVFFGDAQVFNDQPVTQNVTLPGGGVWQVAASPVAGWGGEIHALWGIRLAGLLIALAAALAIYQIFRSRMALTQTNARLNTLLDTIPDLVWVKDPNGVYLACNPRFEAFFGASEADIVGKTDYDFVPADQADFFRAKDRAAIEAGVPSINEEWLTFASDGHRELAETIKTPMYDSRGAVIGVLGIARDITGRKHAEEGVRNLNRVYAVLSGINEAIVRLRGPEELFAEACRIAVEVGGFRMAWLGLADKDSGEVRPQAHAGEVGGYIDHLHIAVADNEHGLGPTGRALREGLHVVCNDIASDPRMAPWRDEALALGYRASAAFPLRVAGELRGTFNLYAGTVGFFNETELRLLDELANDIGFALEFMETDAARENLNTRMVDLLESMSEGFVSIDREWRYQYVNRRAGEILGSDPSSLVGAHIWTQFPEAMGESFQRAYEKAMDDRVPSRIEAYYAPWDKWFENRIYPTHEGISIFFADITARKQGELELHRQKELLDRTGRLAQVGGWQFDVATRKVIWSDETARIHDLEPGPESRASQDLGYFHGPSRDVMEQAVQAAIEQEQPYDLELEVTTAKDALKWVRIIGLPVREGGRVVRIDGAIQDITMRKRAEAEAKQGEILLESVFQAIPDLFFLMDADGTIRDYRAQLASNLYAPPEVFLGKRMQDVIPADVSVLFWEKMKALYSQENLVSFEYDLTLPDGERHFEARLSKLGETGQCIAIVRDITEQHIAKLGLAESEVRYRSLLENAPFPVVLTRIRDGILRYGNHRAEIQFGLSREEGIGQPASRFYQDSAEREHFLERLRRQGSVYDLEMRMLDAAGKPFWALLSASVVEFENEPAIFAAINDITERKRIQAQMELNAKVFEQGSEGIIICDAERNMVSVNRSLCETTGYSAQELLGKNPRIFKSGRHGIDFYRNMWIHVEQQGYWQGEIWNRRKNGDIYPEWLSISTVKDATGKITNYIGMASDITQHKEAEEHIRHLAHFDALTGLPNRTMLNDRIEYAISLAQRSRHPMALMFLDLDRFKNVNDSLGHQVGDQMLIEVAKRLKADVREEDTVSRLGGDEFILLLPDTNADGAAHVAGKIIRTMAAPFMIAGHELSITPSIGIAMYPVDGQNMESLLQCADSAMYRAKQSGYNTYQFFAAEMHLHATRTLQLENALRRALERKELVLHYQPQLDIETGKIIGCEALLRWNHPEFGMISPADFIPIAEDSGQILSIGEWVLRTAVQQNRAWQQAGLQPLVIAVNISAVQFREIHLVQLVSQILREYRLAPEHLELELTERITMKDPAAAIGIMERLHREGIKLSIDDFGTGYSSLSYLKRFRINKLKIDQSFVRDITSDPEDEAIVDAVISLAKSLNLRTIAEGVETVEQLEFLRNKGCDEIQGYYLSRPLPAKEFEALLRANQGK